MITIHSREIKIFVSMPVPCILVIDDEQTMRHILQCCFEDVAHWEVITASSGKEGLVKAEKEQPDAILLDVMMPEMDGLEFIQHLQAKPETYTIPVILLTAKIEVIHNSWDWQNCVVGAIAKPFDPILLVTQVADYLGFQLNE